MLPLRCLSRTCKVSHRTLFPSSCKISCVASRRTYSAGSRPPLSEKKTSQKDDAIFDLSPQSTFASPTVATFALLPRIVKYSLVTIAAAVGISVLALEGTHLYVEHVALAPSKSLDEWGWELERERWTGGLEKGGTDPGLGWKARHALRAAWVALHWGSGVNIVRSNSLAYSQQPQDTGAVEASLEYALDFLTLALALAKERDGLRPGTKREILMRHAEVLERIGSVGSLWDARAEYEKAMEWLGRDNPGSEEVARLALKLGDVNARLGDSDEAFQWWTQALFPASESEANADKGVLAAKLPNSFPQSPYAQRTTAGTLASMSAQHARAGQLPLAQALQDAGIVALKSALPVEQVETAGGRLHTSFISHRSALLALHRAQVLHALLPLTVTSSGPNSETLEALEVAGQASEEVVQQLCASSSSDVVAAGRTRLAPQFTGDKALEKPARSLLRDARRTAIGAWVMAAGEYERACVSSSSAAEKLPSKSWMSFSSASKDTEMKGRGVENRKAALACYERALVLAGISPASLEGSAARSPRRGTDDFQMLNPEYEALVSGYERIRDALLADAVGGRVGLEGSS